VKALAVLVVLAGCANDTDPRWQLAHDRIVAIRTTPAGIGPGESARIDGLITTVSDGPSVAAPIAVTALPPVPALASAIQHDASGWSLTVPADLGELRAQLGLADTDPVAIDILTTFSVAGVELRGIKSVRLDGVHDNPQLGSVTLDSAPLTDGLSITKLDAHELAIDEPSDIAVRWLTSCGSLNRDDDEHVAVLTVEQEDATAGTLVVVVRDALFGVAWQQWSLSAH
jgi:hypothetical protein